LSLMNVKTSFSNCPLSLFSFNNNRMAMGKVAVTNGWHCDCTDVRNILVFLFLFLCVVNVCVFVCVSDSHSCLFVCFVCSIINNIVSFVGGSVLKEPRMVFFQIHK
jgi:hypothetical protein